MDPDNHKRSVPLMIRIPADTVELIDKAITNANTRLERDGTINFCTHGLLTRLGLVEMLLQDVAATQDRPDGWESDNMSDLLLKKGYDVSALSNPSSGSVSPPPKDQS